jgi:small conductance mechanosensitive channel
MPPVDIIIDLTIRYGFQVAGALAILAVGALLARWVGNVVQGWLQRQDMEPPVRILIVRVIRAVVFAFAALAALDKFGVQIAPLIAGIGIAGLGVGIALQGVLSNVIAGLTIIFTKPYRVGEYVEIIGVYGEVISIDVFATVLRHTDQSRVVVPNRKIVGEVLHNYGNMRQMNLARAIVAKHPRVLKNPAPVVGISLLADSAITLSVQPWVNVTDYVPAQAELYQALVEQFRANRIEMPFPQQEVRLLTTS